MGLRADAVDDRKHFPLQRHTRPSQQAQQQRAGQTDQGVAPRQLAHAAVGDALGLARGNIAASHLKNFFAGAISHCFVPYLHDLRSRRLEPSAEWYLIILSFFVFSLAERKNEERKRLSTMLPQAKGMNSCYLSCA